MGDVDLQRTRVESVQMNFLPNVSTKCESCDGNRFEHEVNQFFGREKVFLTYLI